ncbi:MAG TPA: hypothetical protein VGB56_07465 [Flavisolibacter sp.]
MKSLLPLLSLLIVFASCSTAYKSGQTPDDVYFSPAKPQREYVEREDNDDSRRYRRNEEAYYSDNEDRYLRMRIRNRDRWDYLDNYYRDPYAYSYRPAYYYNEYGYSNPRSYWNSYYNPYGGHVVIVNPKTSTPNRPRTYNLRVYDPQVNGNTNTKVSGSNPRRYNNSNTYPSNTPRNRGSELREVFRSSDNNNSAPSKPSSTQSSSGNSSSSGSSSSGSTTAPKRKS